MDETSIYANATEPHSPVFVSGYYINPLRLTEEQWHRYSSLSYYPRFVDIQTKRKIAIPLFSRPANEEHTRYERLVHSINLLIESARLSYKRFHLYMVEVEGHPDLAGLCANINQLSFVEDVQ